MIREDFKIFFQVPMSIIFPQKVTRPHSQIFNGILLLISILIVIGVNLLNAKYNAVINRTLIFLLLVLTLKCIDNKLFRNILAAILLVPVAADMTLQLYALNNFNSEFSYGFALSVLNTTPS